MLGRQVPETTFKIRVRDERIDGDNPFRWQDLPSPDVFGTTSLNLDATTVIGQFAAKWTTLSTH